MKEVSIKEKAKRYDEALRVLHKYDGAHIMFTQDLKEEMFPELKESKVSEDERIRKAMIHFFFNTKNTLFEYWEGIPKSKVITWLEKQGKNNMGISEATKQKLEDNLNKALEKETPESWDKFLDGQGVQKPWSEEDEDILNTIINHFKVDIECTDEDDVIRWLKSLRPQNRWKPSDEQMKALEHFVRSVGESGYASPYDNNTKLLYSLLSDLKKLK